MKRATWSREKARAYIAKHKYHLVALLLVSLWCLPYATTGNKVEWGDFTFFSQAYEAMRTSVVHYHQFPWWNPWVSGGVPLFANPQMGFFSVQMLLVFAFGAPLGLKLAIILYTCAGYFSMYLLLRKYFRTPQPAASLLSLLWLFNTFFVSHLPAHFTFVWYMLSPLFIYLALTVRTYKAGAMLGIAYAIMALSQLHNPFVHISIICAAIIITRLIIQRDERVMILKSLSLTVAIIVVFAGPRILLTIQNLHQFQRIGLIDPAPSFLAGLFGPFVPLSLSHPLRFIPYPQAPASPWGYNEVSSTIGLFGLAAFVTAVFITIVKLRGIRSRAALRPFTTQLVILTAALLCYILAYGAFAQLAPYNILKHLPVLKEMRVSTRWFLFFDFAILVFVGLIARDLRKKSRAYVILTSLLVIGVAESFIMNVGYQANVFKHEPVHPSKPSYAYPFVQTSYFGQTRKLSDGTTMQDDGSMPHEYREYDAMLYNQGILYANDALVQLAYDKRRNPGHPTCPIEEGCRFVRSDNANVTYWSPNKITLKRTAPGPIYLNINESSYFIINGIRKPELRVAEPFKDFVITDPADEIEIKVRPSMVSPLVKRIP